MSVSQPTSEQLAALIRSATDVRHRAFAPYSEFLVGAALLDLEGRIHLGVNVENASYGLTICAERTAVGAAVASGARRFAALVIASIGGVSPCGACRQVLAEFCLDLPIWQVAVDDPSRTVATSLAVLLPQRFMRDPNPKR